MKYYDEYWKSEQLNLRAAQLRTEHGDLDPVVLALMNRYIPVGATCLDVGCGDGKTAGLWLSGTGRLYIGVDVSIEGVRMAQSLGLDARVLEDTERLPFPDDTFDAVVCVEVLEHLFLPHASASEILRVLKPNGVLIATTPNVAYIKRRVELGLFGVWNPFGDALSVEQPWRDPHVRFFTPHTLRRMLAGVGFSEIDIGGHQGLIRGLAPLDPWLTGLFGDRLLSLAARRLHAVARKGK